MDRFTLAVCLAAAAGRAVPEWVEEATEEVAAAMEKLEGRAGQVEAQCLNATEAWVMGERREARAWDGVRVQRGKVVVARHVASVERSATRDNCRSPVLKICSKTGCHAEVLRSIWRRLPRDADPSRVRSG